MKLLLKKTNTTLADQGFVVFDNYLEYKNGDLYWRVTVSSKATAGSRAGTLRRDGYETVTLNNKKYLKHRVIFYMHYGYWPCIVDHIDRDKSNNNIENLREVTAYESACNRSTYSGDFEGIHKHHNKYQLIYKGHYIGRFNSVEEAKSVRNSFISAT